MTEIVKVSGFRELDQKLRDLGEAVARDILTDAVREGANVIRDEARRRAPRRTGVTARSIQARVSRKQKGVAEATIGPTRRAWYARLVEFGTAPHTIEAKEGGVLADKVRQTVFGRKVKHPGTAPRPFLRPALEATRDKVIQTLSQTIWRGITQRAERGR